MEQTNPPKLLDRVRQTIRLKHYSYRTEQTYVNWIVRYIFHVLNRGGRGVKSPLD